MSPAMKEYNDVLVLAKGVFDTAIKEFADGWQWSDLIPIVTENLDKALVAIKGSDKIALAWKDEPKACALLTSHFFIDRVFDLIDTETGPDGYSFPETQQVFDALKGIAQSAVAKASDDDGFQATETLGVVLENLQKMTDAAEGFSKIKDEFSGDMRNYVRFVVCNCVEMVFTIRQQVEAAK